MATAETLLELARSQLGVREDPAGSNRVKYNAAYYGREVAGSWYPWCCTFQWWLFRQAGAGALFYGGGKTASCTELYRDYRVRGLFGVFVVLRLGDLVFFVFDGGRSGCMNHVGLCEKVEPGYVTTIDGNTGDGDEANGGTVARRRRALKYVGGAARPGYEEEGEDEMKIYNYVAEMPEDFQAAAAKAIRAGLVKMNAQGAVMVYEPGLQVLTWLDRLGLLERPVEEGK